MTIGDRSAWLAELRDAQIVQNFYTDFDPVSMVLNVYVTPRPVSEYIPLTITVISVDCPRIDGSQPIFKPR